MPFRLPNLPKPTYVKMKTLCERWECSQLAVIVAGVEYLLANAVDPERQIKTANALITESRASYRSKGATPDAQQS